MVQNFEFHNFWGSQKNEYVLGYKDFADFFFFFFFFFGGGGVTIKLDYTYGSFLCIYGIFVRSRYRMDDIVGSC